MTIVYKGFCEDWAIKTELPVKGAWEALLKHDLDNVSLSVSCFSKNLCRQKNILKDVKDCQGMLQGEHLN